ncbi:MAG: glycosyltransferase [Bacteroidota bacterium]
MLRVFAIYPSFDPLMNEMAIVWHHLAAVGAVHCTVVAKTRDVLKGFSSADGNELDGHLSIHRFTKIQADQALLSIARSANPDVIFCAVAHNLPVALAVAREIRKPIVLHTEFFLDDGYLIRRRYHFGSRAIRRVEANLYRRYLAGAVRLILSSDPQEFRDGPSPRYPSLRYLPWPFFGPVLPVGYAERDKSASTYIGSLSKIKGAGDLALYWRHALTELPDFKLSVIGTPVDAVGRAAREEFQALAEGGRIEMVLHCDREEAMERIRRALFVFSPGKTFGWGLILDAWATGTPVISRSPHFDLVPEQNCLIARSPQEFVASIKRLRQDPLLWKRLQMGGLQSLRQHSLENVSNLLLESLRLTV